MKFVIVSKMVMEVKGDLPDTDNWRKDVATAIENGSINVTPLEVSFEDLDGNPITDEDENIKIIRDVTSHFGGEA